MAVGLQTRRDRDVLVTLCILMVTCCMTLVMPTTAAEADVLHAQLQRRLVESGEWDR